MKAAVPQLFSSKDELDDYQLDDEAMDELEEIHQNFVVIPIDKNASKPAFVCKRFYAQQCMKILENTDDFEEAQSEPNRDRAPAILCNRVGRARARALGNHTKPQDVQRTRLRPPRSSSANEIPTSFLLVSSL